MFTLGCPYCFHEIDIWTNSTDSSSRSCPRCSRQFSVFTTDFNNHSPSEISEHFPYINNKLGEITEIAAKEDQRFCEICGTFYRKDDGGCPNFFSAIRHWYNNPEVICNQTNELDQDLVREEIECFLAVNFNKKMIQRIIGA